jgi:hypothetical protein
MEVSVQVSLPVLTATIKTEESLPLLAAYLTWIADGLLRDTKDALQMSEVHLTTP